MTVVNSPRRPRTAASVPEYEEGPDSSRSRSPVSLPPTEYNQSFRSRNAPRPRNPVSAWQTRNISSILPQQPGPSPERARPLRRRPENMPWLRRQESQVFPEARARNADDQDVLNNNPSLGLPRRRPQWPWQAQAQTSHIFYSEAITSPSTSTAPPRPSRASRSHSGTSCWPWQERARKSIIFDVLTSKEVEKRPVHRKYDWDQRQSSSISECVQQKKDERTQTEGQGQGHASSSSSSSSISSSKWKKWPWQERAMQSVIFTSPDRKAGNRQMKYVWDQRKTRFSVKLDPEAKFSQGSHYSDNYVHWQTIQGDQKAAGRPCYKEEDVDLDSQKRQRSGKKLESVVKNRSSSRSSVIIAHPLPSSQAQVDGQVQPAPRGSKSGSSGKLKTTKSKTTGNTCLELVPVDFDFSAGGSKKSKSPRRKLEKIPEEEINAEVKSPEGGKANENVGSPKKDVNGNVVLS